MTSVSLHLVILKEIFSYIIIDYDADNIDNN